jgi:DNA primase
MALLPGFLDELRTRVTLSTVVGRKVTWDARKSNQGRGDWWAPCPFHQEKSASFHVDDKKGFYYCFGCHAKGDALTFVKEIENLSFMEAVERLAREAGMQMPERDAREVERSDHRTQLVAVMEQAIQWFRLQLKTSAASEARTYITRRGLSAEAVERWELGWAPDQRQGLFHALTQKGIASDLIVAAGLCATPDDGGPPYDRFRGRIIFPIRDGRGRAISLGGRSMDPNARAKYLNGPETDLFDKGRNLYNLAPAREAVGKGAPLIVAEGYMDVIALSEAGFKGAVAPLGTAITEDQLRLMWRISDEPLISLDGDKAGIRAALRLIDMALPLIEAGKGLRFVLLPGGQDPDELIKAQGAAAMQKALDSAQPMVRLLWQREIEGRIFDSPERRAALDKTLRAMLARIADPSLRSHYAEEIRRLRADLFGPVAKPFRAQTRGSFRGKLPPADPQPLSTTRGSLLAQSGDAAGEDLREAVILATLITHPALIARFDADLDRMDPSTPGHRRLRDAMLSGPPENAPARLAETLRGDLDALMARPHVQIAPPVRNREDQDMAVFCLAEDFAKLRARRGARRELADAVEDIDHLADEGLTWRLAQSTDALHRAEKSTRDDATDLGEDRTALSNHLQNLIDGRVWEKKNR